MTMKLLISCMLLKTITLTLRFIACIGGGRILDASSYPRSAWCKRLKVTGRISIANCGGGKPRFEWSIVVLYHHPMYSLVAPIIARVGLETHAEAVTQCKQAAEYLGWEIVRWDGLKTDAEKADIAKAEAIRKNEESSD